MSHINTVTLLVTDWGEWPVPPDLLALWVKAPKRLMAYVTEEGIPATRLVADATTPDGRAYLAREKALLEAIDLIEATGSLRVVAD